MARLAIRQEELWPELTIESPDRDEQTYEIPDDLMARYNKAMVEYYAVRRELDEIQKKVTGYTLLE